MNSLKMAIAGVGLALVTTVSLAQTIAIDPLSDSAVTGDPVNFSFEASDFETIGGAFDLSWDTAVLTYDNNFAFDSGFTARDAGFDIIDFQAPGLLSIGFGNLSGIVFGTTPTTIGSLSFTMGGNPGDMSTLTMVDSVMYAGFFDTNSDPIVITYVNGEATNVVPIPASAWLLGSGLLGLVGVARKKNQRA